MTIVLFLSFVSTHPTRTETLLLTHEADGNARDPSSWAKACCFSTDPRTGLGGLGTGSRQVPKPVTARRQVMQCIVAQHGHSIIHEAITLRVV